MHMYVPRYIHTFTHVQTPTCTYIQTSDAFDLQSLLVAGQIIWNNLTPHVFKVTYKSLFTPTTNLVPSHYQWLMFPAVKLKTAKLISSKQC